MVISWRFNQQKPGMLVDILLVMTNSSPWKIIWKITIFKNGKPSISIGAIYTMAMLPSGKLT